MLLTGTPQSQRRLLIVAAVLGFHALGIWAFQSGLVRRAAEQFIPIQVLAELIEPQPQTIPAAPPPPARPPERPPQRPPERPSAPTPAPPTPEAKTESLPVATTSSSPSTPAFAPAPAAAASSASDAGPPAPQLPVATAPPAPPRVELPSSSADYLNNPRPPYPPLSKRLGEQGKVVVRVFIDAQGVATQAEISSSSGYERLDHTALQTVQRWRYAPGKRNGVPEGMWFKVPIAFVLE
jgi:protein TonB